MSKILFLIDCFLLDCFQHKHYVSLDLEEGEILESDDEEGAIWDDSQLLQMNNDANLASEEVNAKLTFNASKSHASCVTHWNTISLDNNSIVW